MSFVSYGFFNRVRHNPFSPLLERSMFPTHFVRYCDIFKYTNIIRVGLNIATNQTRPRPVRRRGTKRATITVRCGFLFKTPCVRRVPVDGSGIAAVPAHAAGRHAKRRRVLVRHHRARDRHQTGPVLPGKRRADVAQRWVFRADWGIWIMPVERPFTRRSGGFRVIRWNARAIEKVPKNARSERLSPVRRCFYTPVPFDTYGPRHLPNESRGRRIEKRELS